MQNITVFLTKCVFFFEIWAIRMIAHALFLLDESSPLLAESWLYHRTASFGLKMLPDSNSFIGYL